MPMDRFMRQAIARAQEGIGRGQTPFGACIVRGTEVVACEHNKVWARGDCTAHAEVEAIRVACHTLSTVELADCEIYSTCEPCPMCFGAIHWSRMKRVIFGAGIADAAGLGFGELSVSNAQLRELGGGSVEIVAGFLREECLDLFGEWTRLDGRRVY